MPPASYVVCQIGAREHYVLPAALHQHGLLSALVTDIWSAPGSSWSRIAGIAGPRRRQLEGRYTPTLADARVLCASPWSLAANEARAHRWRGSGTWARIMAANRWFGTTAARLIHKNELLQPTQGTRPTVFAYSYAALEILQAARDAGCRTVLGQIDPGQFEDEHVAAIAARHGFGGSCFGRCPPEYWQRWRNECRLADVILVNSRWSQDALCAAGIPKERLRIAPLAFDTSRLHPPIKTYPSAFSTGRPLRLLFLGQVNVRKGVLELLQAMHLLAGAPVQLDLVGPVDPLIADCVSSSPQVNVVGAVPRAEATAHYAAADAMILPTHSDGFAITQIEAQAAGLPLFVSRHCGEVIVDGDSGRFIDPISPDAIAAIIRWALQNPLEIVRMSERAPYVAGAFTPDRAVDALLRLGDAVP
jgi:glycosyltransferase involved in cell wall biosynthesis